MHEHIAASIRRHRLEKHLTQEQLAEALHITPQAVSRWECGSTIPDVLTLIRMANFYGVTLDALTDIGACRTGRHLRDIFAAASNARIRGDLPEAERILRNALRLHPGLPSLQSELALTLMLAGEYPEAIALAEQALAGDISEKVRHTTEACLCLLYSKVGDDARAEPLLRTLPHVWESREYALLGADPAIIADGCADIPALLREMADKLEKYL